MHNGRSGYAHIKTCEFVDAVLLKTMNPHLVGAVFDSCAFDPKIPAEGMAAKELLSRAARGDFAITVPRSVAVEIHHRHTPGSVKMNSLIQIHEEETSLNSSQLARLATIETILTGFGKPEKMKADARHVFFAVDLPAYFVTVDDGILKRKEALKCACGAEVVLPSELLNLLEKFDA